jgi:predicted PurR-regulated permease PerM
MAPFIRIERVSTAVFYAALALLVWLIYLIVSPFLVPLGWAIILAILFMPLQERLGARWSGSRAALTVTTGVVVLLMVPGAFLTVYFVREGLQAAANFQDLAQSGRLDRIVRLWASIAARFGRPDLTLTQLMQEEAKSLATFLAGSLGGLLANVFRLIIDIIAMVFALFFLLRDGDSIMALLRRILPFEPSLRERMIGDARSLIHASVGVSLLIAGLHGAICGFSFSLAGIGEPVFWTCVMSFMALLPVVGPWPVWLPVTIWLFGTGSIGRAILVLVICASAGIALDNFLRPALMSGRSSLSSLSVFIAVIGGIAAFGMIGLVLGPIIFAMASSLLDVYVRPPQAASSPVA